MKALKFLFGWFFIIAGFVIGAYVGLWLMCWWGALTFFQAVSGQIDFTFWTFLWNLFKVAAGFPVCMWIAETGLKIGAMFLGAKPGFE